MKKLVIALALAASALWVAPSMANTEGPRMDTFPVSRMKDMAALQNGARLFANYCLSCHSASLMRWNRLQDIGLDDKQIKEYLIFGNQKVGDVMSVAMRPADAKIWFGKAPPDLSVIARARTSFEYSGPDYLYTFLRGFYRDASSPTGWNNVASPNIAMPHVLWERQGARETTIERVTHTDKGMAKVTTVYDPSGRMTMQTVPLTGHVAEASETSFKPADPARAREFDGEIADLVAYLVFMTDPSGPTRGRIGVWALLAVLAFAVVTWWLNRAFWKSVH